MRLSRKVINLGILFLCFLARLFRGKADKVPANPKKFLILRWKPHMGDIVYITPMFRAIKAKYPDSKLYVVGAGRVEDVIRHNPDIDVYIPYKNSFFDVVRQLRQEKIDFACLTNAGSSIGFAMLYLARIKSIACFSLESGKGDTSSSYSTLKKWAITKPFYTGQYVPPQYLKLLEPIEIYNASPHFRLYFSKEAERAVNEVFNKNNVVSGRDFIVGIAPGGAVPERWWGSDKFAKLADYLYQKHNAKIFLMGAGKDEGPISKVIASLDANTQRINLLNQSLDEFKAFVSKANLIIGNDSGPMVTADSFDVPQLIFVGPTDEREYHMPAGPTYRILKAMDNKVNSISLDEAFKELYYLVSNLRKR